MLVLNFLLYAAGIWVIVLYLLATMDTCQLLSIRMLFILMIFYDFIIMNWLLFLLMFDCNVYMLLMFNIGIFINNNELIL